MPVAEIFSTEALATAYADISYDEKDDVTFVMSESDPEESLVSDYDVTNDLKQALDLDHADDNHMSLLEDTRSTVKTETTQVSEKKSDATSASGEPHSFVQFLMKHEIPRKVFHSLHGFITLGLYILGWSKFDAAKIVWTLFVLVFANDVVRFNFPAVNDFVLSYVRHFMRKNEVTLWNGIVFFLAGAGLVLSYAPKDVAVVSIVLLSWADTAASTVGRAFGRFTPSLRRDKSLAGCLASAFTGLCVCYFFYGYIVPRYPEVNATNELLWAAETSKLNIHVFALITAFITSFSEFVDIGLLDDNFTIPVLCAICLSMVAHAAKI